MTGKKDVQRALITIHKNDLTKYNNSSLDPEGPHATIEPFLQSHSWRNEIIAYQWERKGRPSH